MSTVCDCTPISGPCLVGWQGYWTRTKGDVTITKETTLSPVTVDSAGTTDQRVNLVRHTISFTPAGTLGDLTQFLAQYATGANEPQPGQSLFRWATLAITAYATADAGAATTITISSTAGFVIGQYVTISGSNVAGYNGTWRIAAVTSSTQLKLDVAYISSPATPGSLRYSDTLVIHPLFESGGTEKILTFQNVALTGLPTLTLNATDTIMGAVTFTAIYHRSLEADDAASLIDYRAWTAPTSTQLAFFTPENIKTLPPSIRYATANVNAWTGSDPAPAPWKNFCTANGATINLSLSTNDHVTDSCGLVDIKFTDLAVTVTAQPVGELMTDEEIQKILNQQNSGGSYTGRLRGRSMKAATAMQLWIRIEDDDDTLDFKLPSAAVSAGGSVYGVTSMRNSDLTWQALRTYTGGVRNRVIEAVIP